MHDLFRQLRSLEAELICPVLEVILGQDDRRRTELVGLDNVDASRQEVGMYFFNRRWFREDEVLITTVKLFTSEIVGAQVLGLNVRTHGAVEDDDLFGQKLVEGVHCVGLVIRITYCVLKCSFQNHGLWLFDISMGLSCSVLFSWTTKLRFALSRLRYLQA